MADGDALLDGLDPTQHEAVTSVDNPLAIIAGAGSGKTRVLTRRIAHRVAIGSIDPQRTMAVTFTRKAASELRSRLRQLGMRDGVTTGTFHSLAYAQLHERWAERGVRPPELLDRKFAVIARLLGRRADTSTILDTMSELEWIVARNISFDAYPFEADRVGRRAPIPVAELLQVAQRYAEEKRRQRAIDFDDLLSLAIRDLETDADYAAAVRWRHRHVFVDEFQDVNPLQFRLLAAWTGTDPDLCVVGDPNQAIYGWNGADSWYLRRFERHFPEGAVVKLGHNYRSTPEIIAAAHAVLPKPDREAALPETFRASGPEPEILEIRTSDDEAAAIARAVRDHAAPGQPWSHQAVLVRTNAQAALIATALERARVPSRVRGRAALTDQAEIKPLLKMLRGSPTPLASLLPDLRSEINVGDDELSPAEADRQRNREVLLQLASDHAASYTTATGSDFAQWLMNSARNDGIDSANDAVDVMTFHAAKGLEWNVVHLAGIESGYVPIAQANGPAALSEERRLLHVAITRARDKVLITWAARRTFGERNSSRKRSPYLDHIDASASDERPPKPTAANTDRAKSHLKNMRDKLDESTPDSPLYHDLVEWRRTTAREQGVPAYIVFNNKTLAAIAAHHPASVDELLEVPGIGPAKADRYGTELLEMIKQR